MSAQLSRHVPSAHRFDFAISLVIIGILATLLINTLNKMQVEIEKIRFETEVNRMRLSLAKTWVHQTVTNQPFNKAALINSNPVLLLIEKPNNYIGAYADAQVTSKSVWYFDTQNKQLVYVFNNGQKVRYRLASTDGHARTAQLAISGIDLVLEVKEK